MCVHLIPFKPLLSIVSIQRANLYHCMRFHTLRTLEISPKLCLIYSPLLSTNTQNLLSTNTQNNNKLTNAGRISSEKKQRELYREKKSNFLILLADGNPTVHHCTKQIQERHNCSSVF